jgi:hypothetical protein
MDNLDEYLQNNLDVLSRSSRNDKVQKNSD